MKNISRSLFLMAILMLSGKMYAQSHAFELNKWITDWTLLGPVHLGKSTNESKFLPGFKKDYLSKYGGEAKYKAKAGKKVKIEGATLEWKRYAGRDSVINLDEAVSKESYVLAYAYTEITVGNDGTYILSLGTNDGGRLWLNGQMVWEHPVARGCKPDDDMFPVALKKGVNRIMLKIEEMGNRWEFCMRFRPLDIATLSGKGELFKVETVPDGTPELRSSAGTDVMKSIFDEVHLEVVSGEGDSTVISKENGFLFNSNNITVCIELDNSVALGVFYQVTENKSALLDLYRPF